MSALSEAITQVSIRHTPSKSKLMAELPFHAQTQMDTLRPEQFDYEAINTPIPLKRTCLQVQFIMQEAEPKTRHRDSRG